MSLRSFNIKKRNIMDIEKLKKDQEGKLRGGFKLEESRNDQDALWNNNCSSDATLWNNNCGACGSKCNGSSTVEIEEN